MRNDLRRERKLPGFFDREVYDILDGGGGTVPGLALALAPSSSEVVAEEVVFDSGRSAAAEDGLFSDFEQEEGGGSPEAVVKEVQPIKVSVTEGFANPTPISEKQYQPASRASQAQAPPNDKRPAANPEMGSASHDDRKRKRFAIDGDGDEETFSLQNHLIDVLGRNGKMLTAQLEAQNINFQLDREQRKDHADGLVAVLNKLANALGKLADKL